MTPTRLIGVATAAAVTVGLAAPIVASAQGNSRSSNIVETVLDVSGSEGFDRNGRDYDLLRDALLATGLADAVATTDDITVFAPNDSVVARCWRDCGSCSTARSRSSRETRPTRSGTRRLPAHSMPR